MLYVYTYICVHKTGTISWKYCRLVEVLALFPTGASCRSHMLLSPSIIRIVADANEPENPIGFGVASHKDSKTTLFFLFCRLHSYFLFLLYWTSVPYLLSRFIGHCYFQVNNLFRVKLCALINVEK